MGKKRKTRKPNIIVKRCIVCGATIYVNRSTALYCSDACRMRAYLVRKKLKEADKDMLDEDRSVLESKRPESEISEKKKGYHEGPLTKSIKSVPADTESDFKKLARELEKTFEQIDSYDILGLMSYRKRTEQKISEYEKRFNTTIEVSKGRFPNVNFKFSDPG